MIMQLAELNDTSLRSFSIVRSLNPAWSKQIEAAVRDFFKTSHVPQGVDEQGFCQQTLESIASATFLNNGGDFWLLLENGVVKGYLLARITKDIDNTLTYWISQSWVHKSMRGDPEVKNCWETVRKRALECFCKHIVIVSSRSTRAYCRFLGHGMHLYSALLKEDI